MPLGWNLPERCDLWYAGPDGERHRPLMLHGAIFGTLERFVGVLIEHFGGAFPTWLAPVQAEVLPIADRHADFALGVGGDLCPRGCGWRWTGGRRRWATASVRPRCRRSAPCSWWVSARSGTGRWPRAPGLVGTARAVAEVAAAVRAEIAERRLPDAGQSPGGGRPG